MDSAQLDDLPFIGRVVGMVDGVTGMAAVLEGRLVPGSVARVEAMIGVRASNRREPRRHYGQSVQASGVNHFEIEPIGRPSPWPDRSAFPRP